MTAPVCKTHGRCMGSATDCADCMATPHGQRRACTADQCHQGRMPCPCPQACELPAPDCAPCSAHHLHDTPASLPEALLGYGCVLLVVLVCAAVLAAAA